MATTEKISVAIGRAELKLARAAAAEEGVSLSAFVTEAIRARIEERARLVAARRVLAAFEPEDAPSEDEERALLAAWAGARGAGIAAAGPAAPDAPTAPATGPGTASAAIPRKPQRSRR